MMGLKGKWDNPWRFSDPYISILFTW